MLKKYFDDANINLDITQQENLIKFKNLLLEYNDKFNLTSIKEDNKIYIKHFLDCIYGAKFFNQGKIIEIGSGGGFPSVPLKIYNNNLNFTLVESVGKKCNFLNEVKKAFNFTNFEILNTRCEVLAQNPLYRESFDFVTARAVAKINTLLEYTLPFLKVGGKFIAFKTNDAEELLLAKKVAPLLGGTLEETISYTLPNEEGERLIYIFKKVEPTNKKYPRGQGKERSKPLV